MHAEKKEKKVKVTKKMNIDFPSAIVEEIIARLPTKSLIRFLGMSKEWYSYRSNGKLDKLRSKPALDEQLIRILDPSDDLQFWNFDDYLETPTPLSFPLKTHDNSPTPIGTLVGSCNGLVCISLDRKLNDVVLWNPTTGVFKQLPKPEDTSYYCGCPAYGFGYDSVSDDYKIFSFSVLASGSDETKTQIFSLKANSWKKISNEKESVDVGGHKGLFLNGALHWFSGCREIVAFDLEKEESYVVPQPAPEVNRYVGEDGIGILGECLCKSWFNSPAFTRFQIWIMKEYGVQGSWVRLIELSDQRISRVYYRCEDLLPKFINGQGYMPIQYNYCVQVVNFNYKAPDEVGFGCYGALSFTTGLTSPFLFSNAAA